MTQPTRFPDTTVPFSNRVNTIFLMRADVTTIDQAIIVALGEIDRQPTEEQTMWLALFQLDNDDEEQYGAQSRLLEDGTVRHRVNKLAWHGYDGWR